MPYSSFVLGTCLSVVPPIKTAIPKHKFMILYIETYKVLLDEIHLHRLKIQPSNLSTRINIHWVICTRSLCSFCDKTSNKGNY